MEQVEALVERLRKGQNAAAARDELLSLAAGQQGAQVRELLDRLKRGELLEVQWELDEIIEATTPKKPTPAAEPEPEPEVEPEPVPEEDPNRPLTAADLTMVYDDPRGLMLHRSKVGDRWFATQTDPSTNQPQTFELHAQEVQQIQTQLKGSPYWLLGG